MRLDNTNAEQQHPTKIEDIPTTRKVIAMYDTGSTAFMIVCTMLVLLMTPGLAFFYGGLSRRKNVVNTMIMVMSIIGIVGVMWIACGWSFAYGGDGSLPFFGGFDQLGCFSATSDMIARRLKYPTAPSTRHHRHRLPDGVLHDHVRHHHGRGRRAHEVRGHRAVHRAVGAHRVRAARAHGLGRRGLAHRRHDRRARLRRRRRGAHQLGRDGPGAVPAARRAARVRPDELPSHNIPFVALGAALLWFGWFGFNAGSQFAADGTAALALLNTVAASAAGMIAWIVVERIRVRKPTLVGACTGLVAGLVGITPAAGFVEPWAAIVIGFVTAPCCFFAISVAKRKIGYDDALDAFGCHSVGGVVGGILTGVFCVPELSWTDFGGLIYTGSPALLVSQILGILVTLAFVVVGGLVLGLIVRAVYDGTLRVTEADEARGLDVAAHGESAYPAYLGLD